MLLHLHVEIELGQGREVVDLYRIGPRNVRPAHFSGDFYQPLGATGIKGIIEQAALLILIGLARDDRVAIVHAGQGYRIVLAEGDAADEALGLGGMPAGGGAGEQALGAGRLHGGAAVGPAQAMAIAVVPHRLVDTLFPAGQVGRFLGLEVQALHGVGPAGLPPLQPGGAKGMHKEIEQAGETHAHDRIPSPALAIALHLKAVVEQAGHGQAAGFEGFVLGL